MARLSQAARLARLAEDVDDVAAKLHVLRFDKKIPPEFRTRKVQDYKAQNAEVMICPAGQPMASKCKQIEFLEESRV